MSDEERTTTREEARKKPTALGYTAVQYGTNKVPLSVTPNSSVEKGGGANFSSTSETDAFQGSFYGGGLPSASGGGGSNNDPSASAANGAGERQSCREIGEQLSVNNKDVVIFLFYSNSED